MLFNIASIALLAIGAGAAAVEQPAEVDKRACVTSNYVVVNGDTLFTVAQKLSSGVCAIAEANGIPDKAKIWPSQTLTVPGAGCTLAIERDVCCIPAEAATSHVAVAGDTFQHLSWRYGLSWASIASANPSVNANNIRVGSTLQIPFRRSNC